MSSTRQNSAYHFDALRSQRQQQPPPKQPQQQKPPPLPPSSQQRSVRNVPTSIKLQNPLAQQSITPMRVPQDDAVISLSRHLPPPPPSMSTAIATPQAAFNAAPTNYFAPYTVAAAPMSGMVTAKPNLAPNTAVDAPSNPHAQHTHFPMLTNVQLYTGDQVGVWTIEKKLGEGGFGVVYLVRNNQGERFALKAELANESAKVLKMEVYVLGQLTRARSRHFCTMLDTGRIDVKSTTTQQIYTFNYVVMTLIHLSFQDLRKQYADPIKQKFSLGCALSCGIQCIEAIQELHAVGYLHRDIKPGNVAIARNNPRHIILYDFGMARRFLDANGQVRRPRWSAGFRGTIRYAPISCHISREQSRKCDLETWLYMQIELTRGSLPWKYIETKELVGKYKDRCRGEALKELFGGCPSEYVEIMEYIDNLRYYDLPSYEHICNLLRSAITANNVTEYPYDWENVKPLS